ncbi:MAG: LysM peptidoglycan-binding domain-containing protein [Elusimicrobiota bacterium]
MIYILFIFINLVYAEKLIDSGITKYLEGDLVSAASTWNQVLINEPDNLVLKELVGNCDITLGKEALFNKDYQTASLHFKNACSVLSENKCNYLRSLIFLTEIENNFPTGDEILYKDILELDIKNEKWKNFDLIFANKKIVQTTTKFTQPMTQEKFIIHYISYNETFETIAEKYYKNHNLWEKIWKNNPHIENPHRLFVGDKILVPIDPNNSGGVK